MSGSQSEAILAFGFNLGDPHNEWLFEGFMGRGDDEDFDPEEFDDEVEKLPGVTWLLHAHEWDGRALVLAGRSYTAGFGDTTIIDPDNLHITDEERQLVIDAAEALGLSFPEQLDGPAWMLLTIAE